MGLNGANAPAVKSSDGRGKNGPYPGWYGFPGSAEYDGSCPIHGPSMLPCGAGVICAAPGRHFASLAALEAARMA